MHAWIWLDFQAACAHCQLMSNFSSTHTPKSSARLLCVYTQSCLYSCLGVLWPKCTWSWFTWTHHLSLSRSLWLSSFSSNMVSSENLLSLSLTKVFSSACPNTDPWGTPLLSANFESFIRQTHTTPVQTQGCHVGQHQMLCTSLTGWR